MDPQIDARRHLETLERLLEITSSDLEVSLTTATDLVADTLHADKIDAFLYDPRKTCLVAIGTSHQPLSALQKQHGLDVLQLSNGGRVVHVFRTGRTFRTGRLLEDPEELRGVKEALGIQSKLGVPLRIAGEIRGVLMCASLSPDFFTEEDARYVEAVARWIGIVAHRAELARENAEAAAVLARQTAAEELVTFLAHDFRNFLAPLHLRLDLVKRSLEQRGLSDETRHLQQSILGIDRLAGLVSDLLDIARLNRGLFRLEQEEVNLVPLVEEVAMTLSTPEHPIEVKARLPGPAVVSADRSRLRQAIENLIANGVKHSPRNSPVIVQVLREADDARIEVIDEGPGVSADILPRIFEKFVTGAGDSQSGGLGLGLFLARRIAELHQGDLFVENMPAGGARFVLRLPCLDCEPRTEADEVPPAVH